MTGVSLSRRRALVSSGLVVALSILTACTSGAADPAPTVTETVTVGPDETPADPAAAEADPGEVVSAFDQSSAIGVVSMWAMAISAGDCFALEPIAFPHEEFSCSNYYITEFVEYRSLGLTLDEIKPTGRPFNSDDGSETYEVSFRDMEGRTTSASVGVLEVDGTWYVSASVPNPYTLDPTT